MSRAKEKEVSVLALTDHDTVAGLHQARAQAELIGIELITGIEFSTQWRGRNIHIVGLGFDPENSDLLQLIEKQSERRVVRGELIAERLEKAGFKDILEQAKQYSGDGSLGRPHFAKAMVASGAVKDVAAAFKRYLGNGKVGDVKQMWPDMDECIEPLVRAGGIAVLAHPQKYKLTRTKLRELIQDFKESEGEGIEVVSGRQQACDVNELAQLARYFDLKASCGSDFHAPGSPWSELGNIPQMPESVEPVWTHWQS